MIFSTLQYLGELTIDIPPMTMHDIAELFAIIGTIFTVGTTALLFFLSNRFVSKKTCTFLEDSHAAEEKELEARFTKEEDSLKEKIVSLDKTITTLTNERLEFAKLTDRVDVIQERQEGVLKQLAVKDEIMGVVKASMSKMESLLASHLTKMDQFSGNIEHRVTVLETEDTVRGRRAMRAGDMRDPMSDSGDNKK